MGVPHVPGFLIVDAQETARSGMYVDNGKTWHTWHAMPRVPPKHRAYRRTPTA